MKQIFICPVCMGYTLQEICKKCDIKTENIIPAKYSPEDKYGKYRRKAKQKIREEQGLI